MGLHLSHASFQSRYPGVDTEVAIDSFKDSGDGSLRVFLSGTSPKRLTSGDVDKLLALALQVNHSRLDLMP